MSVLYSRRGSEFLVNGTTDGSQTGPAIAWLLSGGFIVVWIDDSGQGGDASGTSIKAQLFDASGARVGAEFLVNTSTLNAQSSPTVTALSSGGFVVAWQDASGQGGDASGSGIKAQIFDATGAKLGAELLVNATALNDQVLPSVTSLSSGGFVVSWQDSSGQGGDLSGSGVKARIFSSSGAAVGAEFLVNTATTGNQASPAITALSSGGFVTTWQDFSGQGGDAFSSSIKAQLFDTSGSKLGSELLVNTTTAGDQQSPAVAALSSGRFVVSWMDRSGSSSDPNAWDTRAQIFDASGAKAGTEFVVNTTRTGDQVLPTVTGLAGGGFAVSWMETGGLIGSPGYQAPDVKAQVFDASGARLGSEFTVNTVTTGTQTAPKIAPTPAGGFVVSWMDLSGEGGDASGSGIKAQMFVPSGRFDGGSGNDVFTGTGGDDFFYLQQGGNDNVSGLGGNDGFYFGGALTAADQVDGGDGLDQLAIQGNYATLLELGAGNLVGVETLVFLSGTVTRFGDAGGNSYDYNIRTVDANVAAGETLTVNWATLQAGEDAIFDGRAETDGKFLVYAGAGSETIYGGQQNDSFYFGTGFADELLFDVATDHIDGGGGADDQLGLRGNYNLEFSATSIVNVETVALLSGKSTRFGPAGPDYAYTLKSNDANVMAGHTLTVNGSALVAGERVSFDGSAELDGSFRLFGGAGGDILIGGAKADTIYGGFSADHLTGGGGADTFIYRFAQESTSLGFDTIFGFVLGEDMVNLMNLGRTVTGFDRVVLGGALSDGSFDADLAAAVGPGAMAAGQSVYFRPDAGGHAGHEFLIADMNGVAGYQAGEDLVVRLGSFAGYVATLDSPSVLEGNSGTTQLLFTVTLDKPAAAATTIGYQTLAGTSAQAGSDYMAASGQVSFAAGQQSATVSVAVNGDIDAEGDETLQLRIFGASLVAPATATGTILNDETPPPLTDDDVRVGGDGVQTLVLDGDTALTNNSKFSGYEIIQLGTRRDEDGLDGHQYKIAIDDDNAPSNNVMLLLDGTILAADTDGAGPLTAETVSFDASKVTLYRLDIRTGAADDVIRTGGLNDNVASGGGNDAIYYISGFNSGGTDEVDAGAGTDTLVFQADQIFRIVAGSGGGMTFQNRDDAQTFPLFHDIVHAKGIEAVRGGTLTVPSSQGGTINLATVFDGYGLAFDATGISVQPPGNSQVVVNFGTSIPAPLTTVLADTVTSGQRMTLDFSSFNTGIVMSRTDTTNATISTAGGTLFAKVSGFPHITGTALDDVIVGSGAGETLRGGGGNDSIDAGPRGDTIYGGTGNDTLTGGPGRDIFVFDTPLDASTNVDTITDFTSGMGNFFNDGPDNFLLSSSVFTGLAAGTLAASAFVSGTSAGDADDRIIYDSTTGNIYFDADGNGSASAPVLFAHVTPGTELTANHFSVF